MKKYSPHIRCIQCGTRTRTVLTKTTHHSKLPSGRPVKMVFADIETEECPNCGERYYSGQVMHQMERMTQESHGRRRRVA